MFHSHIQANPLFKKKLKFFPSLYLLTNSADRKTVDNEKNTKPMTKKKKK